MDILIKAVAGILVCIVLSLTLAKQGKDISVLLIMAVCCMIFAVSTGYLEAVIDFFEELEQIGKLNSQALGILLKAVGIGMLAEITCLICVDSGHGAMGKASQLLASAVILWLAIPLFRELIRLAENILEAV